MTIIKCPKSMSIQKMSTYQPYLLESVFHISDTSSTHPGCFLSRNLEYTSGRKSGSRRDISGVCIPPHRVYSRGNPVE